MGRSAKQQEQRMIDMFIPKGTKLRCTIDDDYITRGAIYETLEDKKEKDKQILISDDEGDTEVYYIRDFNLASLPEPKIINNYEIY